MATSDWTYNKRKVPMTYLLCMYMIREWNVLFIGSSFGPLHQRLITAFRQFFFLFYLPLEWDFSEISLLLVVDFLKYPYRVLWIFLNISLFVEVPVWTKVHACLITHITGECPSILFNSLLCCALILTYPLAMITWLVCVK
jgi:hypothetical protein